ncbi:MAG: hypothetical protein M3362_12050 [Acidobacteriota bacterium]|nr:hypothetical protein [Acidobacteriota bacterium]
MRTLKVAALLFILCLLPSGVLANPDQQPNQTSLHKVQKIYLEELGTTQEAARFHLLLEEKLTERGFTVVDKPEKADATLSGALSVSPAGIYGGTSDIGVTVQLKTPSGERLWSGNFAGQTYLGVIASLKRKDQDVVEYRAHDLAKKLRADWEKSAKAAGVKVNK